MKKTDARYPDAVAATVEILSAWARAGLPDKPKTYADLSEALRQKNFKGIPPHGGIMTYLLEDASLRENENGDRPMLSALVTSKQLGIPSIGFFELATRPPFSRPLRGTELWEKERGVRRLRQGRAGCRFLITRCDDEVPGLFGWHSRVT